MRRLARFCALVGGPVIVAACARRPASIAPTPVDRPPVVGPQLVRAAVPPANPKLPPVPKVEGALHISVVYPTENALISSRDSNFIFGSVGNGEAGLMINGVPVPVWPNGAFLGWLADPPADAQWYDLIAFTSTDTARLRYPVRTRAAQPKPGPVQRDTVVPVQPAMFAVLRDDSLNRSVSDTDNIIIGRPSASGTYKWFLFSGTPVQVTGYLGERARVKLGETQEIWVDRRDVKRHSGAALRTRLGAPRVLPQADWIDVRVASAHPPAYLVDEDEHGLTLTMYAKTGKIKPPKISDTFLKSMRVESVDKRTVYHFEFSRPVFGYLAMYHKGVMTFRIRRPPTIDPSQPLRGLTITVDPGHPPIGATGPTGLYEPVPTLAVGFRVRDMLLAKGAHVVMTRTGPEPVALGDRPIIARRANADALVSIHLNALPDGMNPFKSNGTGTYYFHPQAKSLASFVQSALVPELGLRDLGTFRENLALARPTPEYQDAYARGIVNGLERFFATFAQ
jgi:N-acetylmuramoyl-L-alanine amidase